MKLSPEALEFVGEALQDAYTDARSMSDQDKQERVCTIADEFEITVYK